MMYYAIIIVSLVITYIRKYHRKFDNTFITWIWMIYRNKSNTHVYQTKQRIQKKNIEPSVEDGIVVHLLCGRIEDQCGVMELCSSHCGPFTLWPYRRPMWRYGVVFVALWSIYFVAVSKTNVALWSCVRRIVVHLLCGRIEDQMLRYGVVFVALWSIYFVAVSKTNVALWSCVRRIVVHLLCGRIEDQCGVMELCSSHCGPFTLWPYRRPMWRYGVVFVALWSIYFVAVSKTNVALWSCVRRIVVHLLCGRIEDQCGVMELCSSHCGPFTLWPYRRPMWRYGVVFVALWSIYFVAVSKTNVALWSCVRRIVVHLLCGRIEDQCGVMELCSSHCGPFTLWPYRRPMWRYGVVFVALWSIYFVAVSKTNVALWSCVRRIVVHLLCGRIEDQCGVMELCSSHCCPFTLWPYWRPKWRYEVVFVAKDVGFFSWQMF